MFRRFGRWVLGRHGNMAWTALMLVAVLLPLASLTIDIPRYFVLRSRLQSATDAAALAAARCIDTAYYSETGQTRLDLAEAAQSAIAAFYGSTASLARTGGYRFSFHGIGVQGRYVTASGSGTLYGLFGTTPFVTVHATAQTAYREIER